MDATKKWFRVLLSAALAVQLVLASSVVSAQEEEDIVSSIEGTTFYFTISPLEATGGAIDATSVEMSATTSQTLLAVLIVLLVVAAIVGIGISLTVTIAVPASSTAALEAYLRQNEVALKQNLTLGGGETISDLAQFFSVPLPHLDRLAQALRRERVSLLGFLPGANSEKVEAASFAERVFRAVLDDPVLSLELVRAGVIRLQIRIG